MGQSSWERRQTMTNRRRRGVDCGGGPVADYRYARTILGVADAI